MAAPRAPSPSKNPAHGRGQLQQHHGGTHRDPGRTHSSEGLMQTPGLAATPGPGPSPCRQDPGHPLRRPAGAPGSARSSFCLKFTVFGVFEACAERLEQEAGAGGSPRGQEGPGPPRGRAEPPRSLPEAPPAAPRSLTRCPPARLHSLRSVPPAHWLSPSAVPLPANRRRAYWSRSAPSCRKRVGSPSRGTGGGGAGGGGSPPPREPNGQRVASAAAVSARPRSPAPEPRGG